MVMLIIFITMRLPILSAVTNVLDSVVTCVPRKHKDWRHDAKLANVHPNLRERWKLPPTPPPKPMPPTERMPPTEHTNHSHCSSNSTPPPEPILPTSVITPSLELSYIVDQMDVALLAYESAANAIAGDLPYLTKLPSIRHPEYPNRVRIDNNYRHTSASPSKALPSASPVTAGSPFQSSTVSPSSASLTFPLILIQSSTACPSSASMTFPLILATGCSLCGLLMF
jgi:hypothetical protein